MLCFKLNKLDVLIFFLILLFYSLLVLSSLKELVTTAEQSNFPDCELLEELKSAVAEAERCGSVATQLVTKKHRTR